MTQLKTFRIFLKYKYKLFKNNCEKGFFKDSRKWELLYKIIKTFYLQSFFTQGNLLKNCLKNWQKKQLSYFFFCDFRTIVILHVI